MALVLVLLFAIPSTALAAGCDPHGPDAMGNWHAYATRAGAGTDAVRADLIEYRPYVPIGFGGTHDASAWVMLSLDQGGQWAQVGWVEEALNSRHTLVQYTTAPNQGVTKLFAASSASPTKYAVSYTGAPKVFIFYGAPGELFRTTPAFVPNKGEIASEIRNTVVQMPGDFGALSFMKFTNMEKRINGVFSDFSPSAVGTSDNAKWYASNTRGGMNPNRELVTADRRGDCA